MSGRVILSQGGQRIDRIGIARVLIPHKRARSKPFSNQVGVALRQEFPQHGPVASVFGRAVATQRQIGVV
jgi:hypothetical protein